VSVSTGHESTEVLHRFQVAGHGDDQIPLEDQQVNAWDPDAVHPDGRLLAVVTAKGIETISLSNGERETLLGGAGFSLQWSPDGECSHT
jgi:hypothetical protein